MEYCYFCVRGYSSYSTIILTSNYLSLSLTHTLDPTIFLHPHILRLCNLPYAAPSYENNICNINFGNDKAIIQIVYYAMRHITILWVCVYIIYSICSGQDLYTYPETFFFHLVRNMNSTKPDFGNDRQYLFFELLSSSVFVWWALFSPYMCSSICVCACARKRTAMILLPYSWLL